MKILLLTQGSRGDVQPFVALGKGLQAAGHTVTLCTVARFERFVTEHGLHYAYMNDEIISILDTPEGSRLIEQVGRGGLATWLRTIAKTVSKMRPLYRQMLDEAWNAAYEADAIVYHLRIMGGYDIAERLGIPAFMGAPLPLYVPTAAFPSVIFPRLPLGGWYNRLTHRLTILLGKVSLHSITSQWRQETLGLAKRSLFADDMVRTNGQPVPVLLSISPHVLPPPSDWPDHFVETGYWFLDAHNDWQPPTDLIAFLNAGPPPIYIGFGSMPSPNPQEKGQLILEALRRTGQRAIVAQGWGGFRVNTLPESVFGIESVPHSWLFPNVSAVVHHGGAGTTAAGLRAGKPAVICPFFGDQPFWGRRVYELGVGPQPIPQQKLTADRLALAMKQATTDAAMQQRASRLGEQIRAENGIRRAVAYIEQHVRREVV
ncbi:MAG: glycosyltransferase [Chloroflexales bacterium]|nr:glycosyltransferase [Chloroflexales bacterium]